MTHAWELRSEPCKSWRLYGWVHEISRMSCYWWRVVFDDKNPICPRNFHDSGVQPSSSLRFGKYHGTSLATIISLPLAITTVVTMVQVGSFWPQWVGDFLDKTQPKSATKTTDLGIINDKSFDVVLLMLQKSGDHQLRLVVYPIIGF